MYEQFRNEATSKLYGKLSEDEIRTVQKVLDEMSCRYDFCRKETALAVIGDGEPEMVKTYLACKAVEGLAAGTLQNYRNALRIFFIMTGKEPGAVTTNDIRVFLFRYKEERGVSSRSQDKVRQYICSFFRWATDEGYLAANPAHKVQQIKYEEKPRQALNQLELEYLRAACKTKRERAMLEMMYSTGCRVSELVGLKESDIDWREKTVHLFGKGRKHRTSFLNAKAEVTLREYLAERHDGNEFLFVGSRAPHEKLSTRAAEKIIKDLADRAGHTDKHITPHVLRHTTATIALQNGMPITDISAMLGHSNVQTTMIYAETNTKNIHDEHLRCVV